jgi:CRP/FNR family cyclic AMP-dependent transcriptional regulator
MKQNSLVPILQGVWLFERCSRSELALIASVATEIDVPAGKILAREGDVGREFFVLLAGEAQATRNGIPIARLGGGSFFGEMALLERQPRAATVTTCEPCHLLVIEQQAYATIVDTMPSVDRKMLGVLAARLRELEERYLPAERYERSASLRYASAASVPIDQPNHAGSHDTLD